MPGPDLIGVLIEDHRAVERVLDELATRRSDPAQRREQVEQAIRALRRHATAEERHLYPLVRQELADGTARAEREISEHAEAERVMAELERLEPDQPQFDVLVGQLVSQTRNHLQEEEHELLPRIAAAVPPGRLRELGGAVRREEEAAAADASDPGSVR